MGWTRGSRMGKQSFMVHIMDANGLRRLCVALLVSMFAHWPLGARAQDGIPSIPPLPEAPPGDAPAAGATNQELLERLLKMEDRLNQVTKQNEQLSREVQELRRVNRDRNAEVDAPGDATRPDAGQGGGSARRGGPSGMPPATSGGGSASGGGDPTKAGSAQLVGNRHRGRSAFLGGTYDFENDGFRWGTEDDEVTIGIRALQQIDARIYANSNQEYASSGVFNPRTRFVFRRQPHQAPVVRVLVTAYLQHDQPARQLLQLPLQRRIPAPVRPLQDPLRLRVVPGAHLAHARAERSPFAQNFGGNRRFGFTGWGSLFDNRLEYAVGSFNGQRNGFTDFNSHQDIMAFLNFKPFEQKSDFILRNLASRRLARRGYREQSSLPGRLDDLVPGYAIPAHPGVGLGPFPGVQQRRGGARCSSTLGTPRRLLLQGIVLPGGLG